MNAPLPRPPELHGVLPPALAAAVEKAQQVADARLSYLLEPGCLRDTFHHDIRALYTLVRINKTLTDYCLRHPDSPADRESAPPDPDLSGPSTPAAPSTGSIASTGSTSSAPSAGSSSHRSHFSHGSHASQSVPFVKSVEDRLASPDPASPTNLLSPLLVRLLDRAEADLGHHMETHMLSRGLERPALFPADVERVAALVSVRVTLAEVAARAPNLPEGALNAWLALALDAGVLGKRPRDPDVRDPELEKLLEEERLEIVAENEKAVRDRQAAKLVDEFLTDIHTDDPSDLQLSDNRNPHGIAGPVGPDLRVCPPSSSESVKSVKSVDSSSLADAPADTVPAETARAAVDALLESAEKSFESLHRRAGNLAREPHVPPFFGPVPESAFALNVDRAEPLPAASAPDPEPFLADQIHLVDLSEESASTRHSAEIPTDSLSSDRSHPSYPSHSPSASPAHPAPKSIRVAPALSAFPKDLKSLVLANPVAAADLTSRASSAAARWIFHTVTDALFLLLRRIHRSIGHPARPPSPFYRPYLPPPWKPLPP